MEIQITDRTEDGENAKSIINWIREWNDLVCKDKKSRDPYLLCPKIHNPEKDNTGPYSFDYSKVSPEAHQIKCNFTYTIIPKLA